MIINFGYVAISMELKDCSPNKTITFKTLQKLEKCQWEKKLYAIAKENIHNTIRLIRYNNAYGIKLYRMTSKIVPLCTHKDLSQWNWAEQLKEDFKALGECIKDTGIRVSTHPDHYTLLNSPKADVVAASLRDLDYHCKMYELMGLGYESKMVIHVGGAYNNKEESIKRFCNIFSQLEDRIRRRIVLENDDKLYTAEEVLDICKLMDIPMVLDIHHDRCNPGSCSINKIAGNIFETWSKEAYPPKIHLSSPKSPKDMRSHHEYIDAAFIMDFLSCIKHYNRDFDVMIEAKMKDKALFKLIDDLKLMPHISVINSATIYYPS